MSDNNVNKDSINRFIFVPRNFVKAHGKNLVIAPSLHYCRTKTESGIILPDSSDSHHEKKYDIGVVVSAGPDCEGIREGNVVVWQVTRGWRLPNGESKEPSMYHAMGNADSIVAVLPNPDKVVAGDADEIAQFGLTSDQVAEIAQWTEDQARQSGN